jgi:RimJ/RimL family protein N-acetyltransferase
MGFFVERATALGLQRDGQIVAGVIYENWNGRSIMAHMAVTHRLTPAFVAAIFDYAFNVCRVEKVICPVEQGNAKSAKLVRHMGFVEEARLKDCHQNGDIVLFTMRKADCRFLEGRYGKKLTSPAGSA